VLGDIYLCQFKTPSIRKVGECCVKVGMEHASMIDDERAIRELVAK
jgi:hypothetical protein